jgi:DnaJ homolog subfamily C member 19
MMKLVWILVLASVACRLLAGRWPWQFLIGRSAGTATIDRARRLLGVPHAATRQDIIEAHRRLVTQVHPDKGGTSGLVHEANEARDVLLDSLDNRSDNR